MPRLPAYRRAIITEAKLGYCLDSMHERGRDKARVFKPALGIGPDDSSALERMLRDGIGQHRAINKGTFGDGTERWVVEWQVPGRLGPLRLVSAWSVDPTSRTPRLVSCYLKKVKA